MKNRLPVISREHLALLREIARAETKLRNQTTILGFVWSFLHPLTMLVLFYILFKTRVGAGIQNYPLFLLIGLVHYTHFSKTTSSTMKVLYQMRSLVTNVIFPKEVLVLGSLLSDVPEFAISIAIVAVIAILTGVRGSVALVILPLILILQLLVVSWVSLALAAAYVFVHDVDHIYEVALRVLLIVTPIFYALDFVGPRYRNFLLVNPLAQLIDFSRGIILHQSYPNLGPALVFFALNAMMVAGTLVVFRRLESLLIERL
jgi:ABC-type polysaccharide/polyol phosphate export permease